MLSRTIVLALPLPLRRERGGGNGDGGEKTCEGREMAVGGEKGSGERRGDRFIVLDGSSKKRSSISIAEETSSIWSSSIETGFVTVVDEVLVVSLGNSGMVGSIDSLL